MGHSSIHWLFVFCVATLLELQDMNLTPWSPVTSDNHHLLLLPMRPRQQSRAACDLSYGAQGTQLVLHLCCPSDIEFIMRTDNEYPWDYYRSSDRDREAVFRMGKLAVHLGSNLREFK